MSNDNDNIPHTAEIIDLGPHENMTPEQVLGIARRYGWTVLVCMGYTENSPNELVMLSSNLDCKTALWLNRLFEDHIIHGPKK